MHIIILTAAVPRADLHSIAIKSFYDNLALSDMSKYTFTHIINIDSPIKIIEQGYTVKDTIDNYKSIIPSFVEQYYIDSKESCFSKAYKKLFIEGGKYIKNRDTLVIWLEDDWLITDEDKILNVIEKVVPKFDQIKPAYFTIGLHEVIMNNNPTIYSHDLFCYFSNYYKNMQGNEKLDPDYLQQYCYKYSFSRCVKTSSMTYIIDNLDRANKFRKKIERKARKYFINTLVITEIDELPDITSNNFYYYGFLGKDNWIRDLGRDWLKDKNIKKWEKNKKRTCKTYIN